MQNPAIGRVVVHDEHPQAVLAGGVDAVYDSICSPETIEIGVRVRARAGSCRSSASRHPSASSGRHRYPLEGWREAFTTAIRKTTGCVKVAFADATGM